MHIFWIKYQLNKWVLDSIEVAMTKFWLWLHIKAGFEKRLKTGAVFINLTAAYDTVWRTGIIYKTLKLLKCTKMTALINNMLTNRTLQIMMNNETSCTKKLNNGLKQGSVLAPLLFNVYIADIPRTTSRQFAYADDLAITTQHCDMNVLSETLTEDMEVLSQYFRR